MNAWLLIIILFGLSYLADQVRQWLEVETYKPPQPTIQDRIAASMQRDEEERERKRRYVTFFGTGSLLRQKRSTPPDHYVWVMEEVTSVKHDGIELPFKVYKSNARSKYWMGYRYEVVEKNVRGVLRTYTTVSNEEERYRPQKEVILYRNKETQLIESWQPEGRGGYTTPLAAWTHVKQQGYERQMTSTRRSA
jgi:hypothetical protein